MAIISCAVNSGGKATECYLGLLYVMEDVAVYGYITPLKVKIILALALSDSVVKDLEIVTVPSTTQPHKFLPFLTHTFSQIFKALHMAYYSAISNPFLKLDAPTDNAHSHSTHLLVGFTKWKNFRKRIDDINRVVGNVNALSAAANP